MSLKLLVAVDGGPTTVHTVRYVAQACRGAPAGNGSAVVLFHVLPPLPPSVESGRSRDAAHSREEQEEQAEKSGETLLEQLKTQLVSAGIPAETIAVASAVDNGDVPAQITEEARRHYCDTIVVGRRGKSMVGQFFSDSVVEKLLRNPIGFTVWVVE